MTQAYRLNDTVTILRGPYAGCSGTVVGKTPRTITVTWLDGTMQKLKGQDEILNSLAIV